MMAKDMHELTGPGPLAHTSPDSGSPCQKICRPPVPLPPASEWRVCPSTVMTFVRVLVQIFHCLDRAAIFYVDVALQTLGEVGVIRHHVAGVHWMVPLHALARGLPATIHRIAGLL